MESHVDRQRRFPPHFALAKLQRFPWGRRAGGGIEANYQTSRQRIQRGDFKSGCGQSNPQPSIERSNLRACPSKVNSVVDKRAGSPVFATGKDISVSIAQVIGLVNQMEMDGVVDRYAIGGAVGATFYLEPVATLDLDIFVALRQRPGQVLVSLRPIFDYLTARGGLVEGEYIMLSGWPVQFLPPMSALVEEALAEAVTVDVAGTPARVLTAEHLAAIALQTGRAKDQARLVQFIEAAVLDAERFQTILQRHGLVDRWRAFERRFFQGES